MNSECATPDIVLFNGTVATQDRQSPLAQAVAIHQDHVLAVGRDADILHLAGPDSLRVNLNGRMVVPGFIDTHIHLYEWAIQRQGLQLDDAVSLDDLLARVRRAAEDRPTGRWIIGQGWNEADWAHPQIPSRQVLDQAAPNHPVLLFRCDLHLLAANSAALRQAGIDAGTPDPPEGCIERDPSGQPTGILRELAINLARRAVPPPGADRLESAFDEATTRLHTLGVTGVHDVRLMADDDGAAALRTFQGLDRDGRLRLRSWVGLPGERLNEMIDLGLCSGYGNDRLRLGYVKYFADGGMGARTAWMTEPYRDAGYGMPLMDMDSLSEAVRQADAAGLSTMVHAIGDRANREVIGIFAGLAAERSRSGRRPPILPHRIEHVQMIRPGDADRLRDLGLALSVNPANMILDINLIDAVVGEAGGDTYAFRRLLDTGAKVMFSSDCPVCSPDPLVGIRAAITRQRDDGTPAGGWYPRNRVTAAEAIRAYTATPAEVLHAPALGKIISGCKADLAVVDRNLLSLTADALPEARVVMTIFDGRVVYRDF